MFIKYLTTYHKRDIVDILQSEDTEKHYSININFLALFEADANLGNFILKDAEKTLEECEKSLSAAQNVLITQLENSTCASAKQNVHCRVYGLPICPELHRNFLPANQDVGMFLQISATVVRATMMKMLEFQKQFVCTKCKYPFTIQGDYEQRYIILQPKHCTNPEGCNNTTVLNVDDVGTVNCKDYQEIKIQEQPSKLGLGRMPNSMWVTLEDDLVDVCKPGDNITICGVVKRRWKPPVVGKQLDVELVLKANHILVNNNQSTTGVVAPDMKEQFQAFWRKYADNPLEGRNIILKSVCPELFGMYLVKLALAIVLAGGSNLQNTQENKIRTRSEPHLLLVGDPGIGKSQLLRFAAKIIPRSVLTTGIGTTSAGLTVTAVMEDGEWQLEAGALVLADGGICCIDEFNSMRNQDRISIHEAMEQQTISVAKASVVCKLSTRCTILAAMNPKRGEDETFGIASPLLSRFDVVLRMRDKINEEWDSQVADYILDGEHEDSPKKNLKGWNVETLQAYFTAIKKINPILSPNASKILSCYYQKQRLVSSRNKARTTVRLLDSLIRLSQGHAKLLCHKEVQITDAVMALVLAEASLQAESSLFGLDFDLSAPFPEETEGSYKELEAIVLKKLHLEHLVDDNDDTSDNSSGYATLLENTERSSKFSVLSLDESREKTVGGNDEFEMKTAGEDVNVDLRQFANQQKPRLLRHVSENVVDEHEDYFGSNKEEFVIKRPNSKPSEANSCETNKSTHKKNTKVTKKNPIIFFEDASMTSNVFTKETHDQRERNFVEFGNKIRESIDKRPSSSKTKPRKCFELDSQHDSAFDISARDDTLLAKFKTTSETIDAHTNADLIPTEIDAHQRKRKRNGEQLRASKIDPTEVFETNDGAGVSGTNRRTSSFKDLAMTSRENDVYKRKSNFGFAENEAETANTRTLTNKSNTTKSILAQFKKTTKKPELSTVAPQENTNDTLRSNFAKPLEPPKLKPNVITVESVQDPLPSKCKLAAEKPKTFKFKAKEPNSGDIKETDLLKMIPSVADGFDFDSLNFGDDLSGMEEDCQEKDNQKRGFVRWNSNVFNIQDEDIDIDF